MSRNWKLCRLGEIAPYWTSKIEVKNLEPDRYISTDNMLADKGGISGVGKLPPSGKVTSYQNGDILVSNIRPYFKKIWFASYDGGCSNDVLVFRPNTKEILPKFVYYLLMQDTFFDYMMAGANGVKMPRGNKTSILEYEIFLPSLAEQAKILAILSSYDSLIDNNLHRIKLLEEIAQITYEEWFVRMKFPGQENATTDSETGLPEGWSEQDLSSVISIKHGYAYKGEYFTESETSRVLLTPGNFKIGGGLKLDKVKYYNDQAESPKDYVLKKHDLLVTMTDLSKMADTLGFPLLVPSSAVKVFLHNQRLGKVQQIGKGYFPKYFYYMLFKDDNYRGFVVGSSSGATVKHTSPSKILSFKPKLPPLDGELIAKFDTFAKPMFEAIDNLLLENNLLSEARDILLPRLMTGMINVDTIELPEALLSRSEENSQVPPTETSTVA